MVTQDDLWSSLFVFEFEARFHTFGREIESCRHVVTKSDPRRCVVDLLVVCIHHQHNHHIIRLQNPPHFRLCEKVL